MKNGATLPVPLSSPRVYNKRMDAPTTSPSLDDFLQPRQPGQLGRPAGLPTDGRLQDGGGRVRYTHDALVDTLIARPEISQGELAAMFGFTQAWISILVNSDAFKKRLAERKAVLVDPMISATVNDRLLAVTNRSLEVLAEKLSQPANTIDPDLALKAAAMGVKSLVPQQSQAVQVNVDLASLAENMLKMQQGLRPAGEVVSEQ